MASKQDKSKASSAPNQAAPNAKKKDKPKGSPDDLIPGRHTVNLLKSAIWYRGGSILLQAPKSSQSIERGNGL